MAAAQECKGRAGAAPTERVRRARAPEPARPARRLQWKTPLLVGLVIVTNLLGNVALGLGMKRGIALAWIATGIALLLLWLLSRMTLLSWADLSYVLPVTSLGYVLTAVMGRLFLAEQVSWQRWAGTLLIVAGAALVGQTNPRSAARP